MTDRKIEFIGEKKIPYRIEVREGDGYLMGEYYFKFTKEELEIIKWFLSETDSENNYTFTQIKEDIFSERGTNNGCK